MNIQINLFSDLQIRYKVLCCSISHINFATLGQLSTEIGVKIVSEYDQETPQSQTADNIIL